MMFWYNGKIHQVVVGEVLHIVGMVHGAVVYLSGTYLLHTVIIMECSRSAYHKHHLAVALVGMQSCGSSRTKCRIHDLHLVVHEVSSVQLSFSSLEALEMSLSNFSNLLPYLYLLYFSPGFRSKSPTPRHRDVFQLFQLIAHTDERLQNI